MGKYLKHYWYLGLLGALFMIGEVTVDLVQPRLMETIVDDGILGLSSGGAANISLVLSTGISMILIVLAGGTSGVLCGVFVNLFAQHFGNDLRKDCFAKVMHFSFEQTDTFTSGSLITRMTNDVTQVQNMASQMVRGCVRCGMFLIAGTACLLTLDLHFMQILMIALPVILVEIVFVIVKTTPLFDRLQKRLDQMNTVIRENVTGIRVVKAFVQEERESRRFEQANEALSDTQFKVLTFTSFLAPVMNLVLNIAVVFVIKTGAVDVAAGSIAPGTIMAAVTYITLLLNGLHMLALIFQTISRGLTSMGRLQELLDTEPSIQSGDGAAGASSAEASSAGTSPVAASSGASPAGTSPVASSLGASPAGASPAAASSGASSAGTSPVAASAGASSAGTSPVAASAGASSAGVKEAAASVSFDHVSFHYRGHAQDVLHDITWSIRSGEAMALIGSTGCGKSTLVSLIPRFYDVADGCVRVDGEDVRSCDLETLRHKVAFVLQKSEMFSGSIRDNIAMGCPEASEEEIQKAARAAQAQEFILRQPQGYDTPVTQGGTSLSGGQKQRIAIARALLRKAPILILDDATSALDLKTEAALHEALQKEYPACTRIIIAQRIATVMRADRIAVMDGGRIIACGTHEHLMKDCPLYVDIYNSQLRK